MFVGEDDSPFGNLPAEMVAKIFKARPYRGGKWTARKVCRRWRYIVDDPWWKLTCFKARIDSNESSAVAFMKSRIQFESLFIRGIGKNNWPEISLMEPLPQIQRLTLGSDLSEETLFVFLSCGRETLEYLNFLGSSLTSVTTYALEAFISQEADWSNLAELHLSVEVPSAGLVNGDGTLATVQTPEQMKFQNKMENHSDAIVSFLRLASAPKLKIFNFYLASSVGVEVGSRMTTVVSEFTGFLERHAVTLKDLYLSIYLCLTAQPKFCLTGTIFSPERQESLGNILQLESISICISHSAALVNLVPPCLWASRNLNKLTWSTITWKAFEKSRIYSPYMKNPVQPMIMRSQETLVSANIMFGDGYDDIFQLRWLETCSALKDLTLTYIRNLLRTDVEFPQVKSLTVSCRHNSEGQQRIGDFSGWITKSFENLENITIYGLTHLDNHHECDWLENLLPLIKLKLNEINFSTHWSCSTPGSFEVRVKTYCSRKTRLDYVSKGLIIILPPMEEESEEEESEEEESEEEEI